MSWQVEVLSHHSKVLVGCREFSVPQGWEDHPQQFPGQIIRSVPGFLEESQEYLSMT